MNLPTDYKHTCERPRSKPPAERSPPKPPKSGFGFLAHALDSLESLPSVSAALDEIATSRRNGRPGYPPTAMFRALALKYLLGERYTVALIERLRASPRLREICGFSGAVPSEATFSRFVSRLVSADDFIDHAIPEMVERLRRRLPDVGENVAVDSTDVQSYSRPLQDQAGAAWGFRTTKARNRTRNAAETEPFFGYKVHAISDIVHGVPLAHITLPANKNDSPQLPALMDKAKSMYGWLKPKFLCADRGYDSMSNHRPTIKRGIVPVIHIRRPPGKTELYDDLYTARGHPVCGDGKTPMEYVATDPETGFHGFRCPPGGCALKARSRGGAVQYCGEPTVWFDPADNPRAQ